MNDPKRLSFPGFGIEEYTFESTPISLFDGKFTINWYALIITTAIILAALYVWFRFKEHGLKTDDFLDLALWVVLSGIVGARLYFIIFKLDDYIITDQGGFFQNLGASLYEMIAVWKGGLAIYGGVIAGGVAGVLVARKKKINLLQMLDFLAPPVMMAQGIGRWGNFFNVEAFGSVTDVPWRMAGTDVANYLYTDGQIDLATKNLIISGELGVHPTFFYESMWNLLGFLAIWLIFVQIPKTKKLHLFNGQLFYTYLIWYGLGRAWIEGLRTDSLYLVEGVIRVSQLIAILSLVAGIGLMIFGFVRYFKYGKGKVRRACEVIADANKEENKKKKEEEKKKEGNKEPINKEQSESKEKDDNGTDNQRQASVPDDQTSPKDGN